MITLNTARPLILERMETLFIAISCITLCMKWCVK